jgi:predicted transcriptional regulator of viral defense system
MNYPQFRNQFFDFTCFGMNQVYAWQTDFDKSNITRWTKQNLLVKLRNGFYSFPEYLKTPDFTYFISNRIYRPSYVSLHSALAFYGIIPEAVITTTAVGTLKKANFENAFGAFSYQQILPELMFGYEQKPFLNGQKILFAQPEKAILDLLYLYPFYNNEQEISELRFDEDFMQQDLNVDLLNEYTNKFQSKTVRKRVDLLLKIYAL